MPTSPFSLLPRCHPRPNKGVCVCDTNKGLLLNSEGKKRRGWSNVGPTEPRWVTQGVPSPSGWPGAGPCRAGRSWEW